MIDEAVCHSNIVPNGVFKCQDLGYQINKLENMIIIVIHDIILYTADDIFWGVLCTPCWPYRTIQVQSVHHIIRLFNNPVYKNMLWSNILPSLND